MKLKYLKYFEGYKLEPHRNYEERNKYVEKKLLKILQNESYNGNLDLSGNKYPNIKDLGNLKYLKGNLKIIDNKTLENLNPLINVTELILKNTNIKDLGNIKDIKKLSLINNPNITELYSIRELNYIYLYNMNMNLDSLTSINYVKIIDSIISDMGYFENCLNINIENSEINNLGSLKNCSVLNLKYVKGIKNLEPLKSCNILKVINSNIEDISSIQNINTYLIVTKDTKIPDNQLNRFKHNFL